MSSRKFGVVVRVAALVALALLIGSAVALVQRSFERERARRTQKTLAALRAQLGDRVMPYAWGLGSDPTGQVTLARFWVRLVASADGRVAAVEFSNERRIAAFDAWDRPFLYRCPGPVHTKAWDLYSTGPDGIDDGGAGDDILVGFEGADVARR